MCLCCFCCCDTRESFLIYLIVITSIAILYGLYTIISFGSSTSNYKSLKDISGVIKHLKGIENGIGSLLFLFELIFLGCEILFLIFVCGKREYTVLSEKKFKIFNVIKICCFIISSISIFMSLLYIFLLIIALFQYFNYANISSCSNGIFIGIIFGLYSFYFYISFTVSLCKIRERFLMVGNDKSPGPEAKYDLKGSEIQRPQIIVLQQEFPYQNQNGQKAKYANKVMYGKILSDQVCKVQYIPTEEIPSINPNEKIPSYDPIQTNNNVISEGDNSKENIKKIEEKDNPENNDTKIDNK